MAVGLYADFNSLKDYIIRELEAGKPGSRFPTFVLHPDANGEWTVIECEKLKSELSEIIMLLKAHPPMPFVSEWQKSVARASGVVPSSAFESFIDVDGGFVLERIYSLASVALASQRPILFQ